MVNAWDSSSRVVGAFRRVVAQQPVNQLVNQLSERRILASVVELIENRNEQLHQVFALFHGEVALPRRMRLLKCGSWCPTRLPVIKLLTRQTRRFQITLRNDFLLYRSGGRSLGWCRVQSWCRRRSWPRRCQHWCWQRRLSAHTTSKRVRTFVIARAPPLAGVTGQLFTANCLRLMTISAPLLPLELTSAFFPERGISVHAQRRFLFDNFEVHGYTLAAASIPIIVIARVPPLTGATDIRHVLVSTPLLPLELTDALCEGTPSACAKDCPLFEFRGLWVAFQHMCCHKISDNRHRTSSTIDRRN